MNIAYIVPGTGGSFYCENCIRDCAMITGLRDQGYTVTAVPMYLPLIHEENVALGYAPPFFGAVRIYLQYRVPLLRFMPHGILRFLDSPAMLAYAASKAATTRAAGHENMTLAMLKGLEGPMGPEFERLVRWVLKNVRPDVVFLSNAFLLGAAQAFKALSRVTVACMVQDEHTWVEAGVPDQQSGIWQAIAGQNRHADVLLSLSQWYAKYMSRATGIAEEKFSIIPFGVDPGRYTHAPANAGRLGFLSRLSRDLGLRTIGDAYAAIRSRPTSDRFSLELCGGYTRDDNIDIEQTLATARSVGEATMAPGFGLNTRTRFLAGLSALAVPSQVEIALGTFIFESLAAGVPVAQPDEGGFSEVVNETGGGILYSPNTAEALADALDRLLNDNAVRSTCIARGHTAIAEMFNHRNMARSAIAALP